jgi:hypothetical protein
MNLRQRRAEFGQKLLIVCACEELLAICIATAKRRNQEGTANDVFENFHEQRFGYRDTSGMGIPQNCEFLILGPAFGQRHIRPNPQHHHMGFAVNIECQAPVALHRTTGQQLGLSNLYLRSFKTF